MNPIGGPMRGRGVFDRFIEHRLKGKKRRMEHSGDALGGGAVTVKLGEPLVVHRAAAQHERLADDELLAKQSVDAKRIADAHSVRWRIVIEPEREMKIELLGFGQVIEAAGIPRLDR